MTWLIIAFSRHKYQLAPGVSINKSMGTVTEEHALLEKIGNIRFQLLKNNIFIMKASKCNLKFFSRKLPKNTTPSHRPPNPPFY